MSKETNILDYLSSKIREISSIRFIGIYGVDNKKYELNNNNPSCLIKFNGKDNLIMRPSEIIQQDYKFSIFLNVNSNQLLTSKISNIEESIRSKIFESLTFDNNIFYLDTFSIVEKEKRSGVDYYSAGYYDNITISKLNITCKVREVR